MHANNVLQQPLIALCVIQVFEPYQAVNGVIAISTFMITILLWFVLLVNTHATLVQILLNVLHAMLPSLEYLTFLINTVIVK
jgi:hypothetical protein